MATKKERTFTVSVLREGGVIYYGDCTALTVPTLRDPITVLAQHTPLIAKLGPGSVILRNDHDKQELTQLKSGLMYVGENEVTVLVDL